MKFNIHQQISKKVLILEIVIALIMLLDTFSTVLALEAFPNQLYEGSPFPAWGYAKFGKWFFVFNSLIVVGLMSAAFLYVEKNKSILTIFSTIIITLGILAITNNFWLLVKAISK